MAFAETRNLTVLLPPQPSYPKPPVCQSMTLDEASSLVRNDTTPKIDFGIVLVNTVDRGVIQSSLEAAESEAVIELVDGSLRSEATLVLFDVLFLWRKTLLNRHRKCPSSISLWAK